MMQEGERPIQCPLAVARHILSARHSIQTTPMHLIKLVYLCHGWMLGVHRRPLIHEDVVAWRYGPVVPTVYHMYKSFGGSPIDAVRPKPSQQDVFDGQQLRLMDAVLNAYQDYSAFDLSAITHQAGTPWHVVYAGGHGRGAIIPNALIQQHYAARLASGNAEA